MQGAVKTGRSEAARDQRFRATIHYDGSEYHGWQLQPALRTVQGEFVACLGRLLSGSSRDRGKAVVAPRVESAGRTDAGVHSAGQEVAFDVPHTGRQWPPHELLRALNAMLPDDVWVESLREAAPDFHPRFDATGRRYEYLVGTRPDARSPLRARRVWALDRRVDEAALVTATRAIEGEHSFAGFARSGQPHRGTRCRVQGAGWSRTAAGDLHFVIVADRFLRHMVRYLVRTLIEVGTGHRGPEEPRALLVQGADVRPPAPAPAWGLYLTGVRYEDGWNRLPGVPGAVSRERAT